MSGKGYSGGGGGGGGSGASAFVYGKTGFVDATNGDDSTAVWGRIDKPFQTITTALANVNCVSGCAVFAFAGSYSESFTLASGVSIFGPDATLTGAITCSGSADNYITLKKLIVANSTSGITHTGTNDVYCNIKSATVGSAGGSGAALINEATATGYTLYYSGNSITASAVQFQIFSCAIGRIVAHVTGNINVTATGSANTSFVFNSAAGADGIYAKIGIAKDNSASPKVVCVKMPTSGATTIIYIEAQEINGFSRCIHSQNNGNVVIGFIGNITTTSTAILMDSTDNVYIFTPNNITGTITPNGGNLSGIVNGKPISYYSTLTVSVGGSSWNLQTQSNVANLDGPGTFTIALSNFFDGMKAWLAVNATALCRISFSGYIIASNTSFVASGGMIVVPNGKKAILMLVNTGGTVYVTATIDYT
jgi:hypothetical protein